MSAELSSNAVSSATASAKSPLWMKLLPAVLRGFWLNLIPLLATGFVFRYLVPTPIEADGHFYLGLTRFVADRPVVLAILLFASFGVLLRYWQHHLPGGAYMTQALPFSVALNPVDLERYAAAAKLYRSLATRRSRRACVRYLSEPQRKELEAQLDQLRVALANNDPEQAEALGVSLSAIFAPVRRAIQLYESVSFVGALVLALGVAFFLRAAVVESFQIISASMLPALEPGDRIVVNKLAYKKDALPRRGELIVFKTPAAGADRLIKRVVGLPGDHIAMHDGHPLINGWTVPSCEVGTYAYLSAGYSIVGQVFVEFLDDATYLTVYRAGGSDLAEYAVKPGEVFVLGDNRNNSADSRFWGNPGAAGLPTADIDGHAILLLSGTERDGRVDVGQLLRPITLDLNLHGIDVRDLEQTVERCLTQRPLDTVPPQESRVATVDN